MYAKLFVIPVSDHNERREKLVAKWAKPTAHKQQPSERIENFGSFGSLNWLIRQLMRARDFNLCQEKWTRRVFGSAASKQILSKYFSVEANSTANQQTMHEYELLGNVGACVCWYTFILRSLWCGRTCAHTHSKIEHFPNRHRDCKGVSSSNA